MVDMIGRTISMRRRRTQFSEWEDELRELTESTEQEGWVEGVWEVSKMKAADRRRK